MRKILLALSFLVSISVHSQTEVDTKSIFGNDTKREMRYLKDKVNYQQFIIDDLTADLKAKPKVVIKEIPTLDKEVDESIKQDEKFVDDLPKEYKDLSKEDLLGVLNKIESKIENLLIQRDSLLKSNGNVDIVTTKNKVIKSLEKEKTVINLTKENVNLNDQNVELADKQDKLRKYLYVALSVLFVLILIIAVILQRRKIKTQDVEIDRQLSDINKKNNYLEHAARIIRHDMHSGINTYMPRGLSSLERRIDPEKAKELKIDGSIKMIKDGLNHTKKVYKSVYEFTKLVKQNVVLETEKSDLKELLSEYVNSTAYGNQVKIGDLVCIEVNPSLFCTALDNLIRNGLSFNGNGDKLVKVYMEGGQLTIEDNGRGLKKERFEKIKNNKETGGLGLNIALAIIEEHGFTLSCEEIPKGTKMKIKFK
jgi:signal transduction histidine kinase